MKLSELRDRVDRLIAIEGDVACAAFIFSARNVPEGLDAEEVLDDFERNDGDPMHWDYLLDKLEELIERRTGKG